MWVPAHVGIIGNETADKLARKAIDHESPDIIIPLSISEFRPVLISYILHPWQVYWETIEAAELYKHIVPNVSTSIKFQDSNRSLETTITRLRLNHNQLNDNLARTGSNVSPLCGLCQDNETAHHFFFECFRYNQVSVGLFHCPWRT